MHHFHSRRTHGLGLIDLMVGLAIGMVATVVILNVMVMFDARRRSVSGGADAQVNAAFASAWLARELRIAGHGLGPSTVLGCKAHRAAAGMPDANFTLAPVTITQGDDGAPDTLMVLAASEQALPAARLIAPYTIGAGTVTLDSILGITAGTQLLLHTPGQADCALLSVATTSVGAYTLQPVEVSGLLSDVVFATDSTVVNLGRLRYRRLMIDAAQRLQLSSFNSASGEWVTSTQSEGVVNLQLQYGFDTRTGTQTSPQVTRWSDLMLDADEDGQVGDSGDWQRLVAIRFALVVRSTQRREASCDAPVPTWLAGDETGELVVTDISLAHIAQWRCWRYRVLQAAVPLRNQLWREP
ncbi:MAG: PilW family protein [Burkholderiaceae bacterium]